MNKYNYNWKVLIEWALPSFQRWPINIAWIYDMMKYFRTLHTNFLSWGADRLDEVSWNSQTIVLTNLLVGKFGAGIYIVNQLRKNTLLIGWPLDDSRNIIAYPMPSASNKIGYPLGEYDQQNIGFIVYVPDTLVFDLNAMKAALDKYKMIGVNYDIQYYTL
jgi:hypothetical protein